ncbi:S8 family serine peptidase [Paractinoplanes durhamensis]|uniref:Peptidase S8/S53 domain-containing protein n=1 Tax=Paractinoplanes durhamensis TaxID=113563 RepID=A0ABQ3ZCF2_9ACTN|nr:S8 family serine peptidase [Actinoplanes durhamensis]GIE07509.1 hypothetical protein Adu01nite_88590 [Actinoplanes durhamensis]
MRVVSTSLIAALLVGLAAAPAAAETTTQRLILGVTADADRAAIVGDLGAWRPVDGLDAITVDVPSDEVSSARTRWQSDPDVRYAAEDSVVKADSDPMDRANVEYQQINQLAGAEAWTTGSPATTVAVIDSGIVTDWDLPPSRVTAGYDFVDGDTTPQDVGGRHGLLVASLIAAEGGNNYGTTGICPSCRIMPIRALKSQSTFQATGYASDLAAGIVWAVDHGAKIINISASTASDDPLMREAVDRAAAKDVLVVGSAGHGITKYVGYPAALDSVLAVGAVGNTGLSYNTSNVNTADNRWIDVAATSTYWTQANGYGGLGLNGTSASAAVVSAVAALAYAIKPDLTVAELRRRIVESANQIPAAPSYHAPVLDATRLLYDLGQTDTGQPVVTDTGLTENQVIGPNFDVNVTPAATDDHAVERMELLVDGVVVSNTWRTWSRTMKMRAPAGANGPHQVTTRAYDYAGLAGEKSATVVFDSTAPVGEFLQPAADARVHSGYQVVVTAPADAIQVMLNGDAMTHTAGTTTWTAGGGTSGNLIVQMWDEFGNMSLIVRQVVLDDSGPTATGLSPATGTRVRGTFFASISGVADPSGIAYTQLFANGKLVGNDVTYPYGMSVPTGTGNGTMTLAWRMVDKLGNVTTYTRYPIVDNAAPTVSISKAPGNKAKVKGTVKVYVSATDPSGIARVELLINGKVVAADATASYLLAVNTGKVAKTMKVQVRAYDRLGNVRSTSTRTWYRK